MMNRTKKKKSTNAHISFCMSCKTFLEQITSLRTMFEWNHDEAVQIQSNLSSPLQFIVDNKSKLMVGCCV